MATHTWSVIAPLTDRAAFVLQRGCRKVHKHTPTQTDGLRSQQNPLHRPSEVLRELPENVRRWHKPRPRIREQFHSLGSAQLLFASARWPGRYARPKKK